MILEPTEIAGVFTIPLEKRSDERGFLARIFDQADFEKQGIHFSPQEAYVTQSLKKGTMRGIHVQLGDAAEEKLTRVTRGAVYEVVIDLRPDSPTYLKWQGLELKVQDYKMLYVPKNVAHAILILEDNTDFENWYSRPFSPGHEHGIRYDDSFFQTKWPIKVEYVSEKDLSWPQFKKE